MAEKAICVESVLLTISVRVVVRDAGAVALVVTLGIRVLVEELGQ